MDIENNYLKQNHLHVLMFKHYLNYCRLMLIMRIINKPCNFIFRNKYIFERRYFVNNLENIFREIYGVVDILNNDKDAIVSRLWFIQYGEDRMR